MRRPVRTAFLLGLIVGVAIALVRALRAEGSSGEVGAGAASLPPAAGRGQPAAQRVPARGTAEAPADLAPGARPSAPASEPPPDVVAPVVADPVPDTPPTADPGAGTEVTGVWVPPVDDVCPEGYPVKAKEGSRIFHVPDGAFYGRTVADRCYPTPEAAEADGLRASKR